MNSLFEQIRELSDDSAAVLWDALAIVIDPTVRPNVKPSLPYAIREYAGNGSQTLIAANRELTSVYYRGRCLAVWSHMAKRWIVRDNPDSSPTDALKSLADLRNKCTDIFKGKVEP